MGPFRTTCFACGSGKFKETLMKEECSNCGILVDYSTGRVNEVYERYESAKELEEQDRRYEESRDYGNE